MRALLLVVVAACQPMYRGASEPLHHVPAKPGRPTAEAPPPVVYVESCEVDFHRDPRAVARKQAAAETLVTAGDTAVATATKAQPVQPVLLVDGIEKYSAALRADPYNAGATLKLALAYDHVLHKGCALALLHRLKSLADNPKVAPDAPRRIADIEDNAQWFKAYRHDALDAVH